jgi:hypothetical protein
MSASKIINLMAASVAGAFSIASFNGNLDCYEDNPTCTTQIVNELAKKQAEKNLIEKDEPEIKQSLESGDQIFTLDTKSNLIEITKADVKQGLESKKQSARSGGMLYGTFAAFFLAGALPRPGRKKDEDEPEESKGKQPMENNLG